MSRFYDNLDDNNLPGGKSCFDDTFFQLAQVKDWSASAKCSTLVCARPWVQLREVPIKN